MGYPSGAKRRRGGHERPFRHGVSEGDLPVHQGRQTERIERSGERRLRKPVEFGADPIARGRQCRPGKLHHGGSSFRRPLLVVAKPGGQNCTKNDLTLRGARVKKNALEILTVFEGHRLLRADEIGR